MKKNVGSIDKIVRFVLAGAVIILFLLGHISGPALLIIMGTLAFAFLVTALTGFCPLYSVFGFSSCPNKNFSEENIS